MPLIRRTTPMPPLPLTQPLAVSAAQAVSSASSRPAAPLAASDLASRQPRPKLELVDEVDLWTTAFEPESLDHFTEIEMPADEDRWIRVDLSEQQVIAYQGLEPIRGFVISSGMKATPTVQGRFRIRTKVSSQTMSGGNSELGTYYNLPGVKWVQYFHAEYGFHGTYWHQNFGNPMSHGCVNMTNADAKWLFDWAGPEWDGKSVWYGASQSNPGTLVIVHE